MSRFRTALLTELSVADSRQARRRVRNPIEDPARVDATFEHVGQQLFDVGEDGSQPPPTVPLLKKLGTAAGIVASSVEFPPQNPPCRHEVRSSLPAELAGVVRPGERSDDEVRPGRTWSPGRGP